MMLITGCHDDACGGTFSEHIAPLLTGLVQRCGIGYSRRRMTQAEFLASMDELLELPAGTLTGSEKLEDLEAWDSMAMVGFIALADSNGAKVAARQVAGCDTVADLMPLAGVQQ
jgi:acyl carrier protein